MGGGRAPSTTLSVDYCSSGGEISDNWSMEQSVDDPLLGINKPFGCINHGDDSALKDEELEQNERIGMKYDNLDDVGRSPCSISFDDSIRQRRRRTGYQEIMRSYLSLELRKGTLEEAKSQILSYTPGAWIEEVGGLRRGDYKLPKTTTLLLIGPRGSGKSSLVNKISGVFEGDKFSSVRAQVSYNSFFEGGTYFLQEYMIPRGSTSFCLYDTRSLSDNLSDNYEMLKSWITKGVRHGELVIRDSDSPSIRKSMKCKARGIGYWSKEARMVNFVIFVVNGVSVLKSMDDSNEDEQYPDMLAKTFSCPYLSFKDAKPVVVFTHGDLLSRSERARVRIHLGELLGVPPDRQIFDIPEKIDAATELIILDMLQYSLEHADRNLPCKNRTLDKVVAVFKVVGLVGIFLLAFCIAHRLRKLMGKGIHRIPAHEAPLDWHAIRHLWLG
ncbi:uncharacterized protein LOC122090620 [Macadamia integrifolia]|uniref:uncharacterized protein LOC122090620 n=1 Tax=Macadamia integrifolia TaxID=60698 RepID=UPI001C4E59D8|nr:uncharacterized protein LOC122090620 [Macadamia integrifolia]